MNQNCPKSKETFTFAFSQAGNAITLSSLTAIFTACVSVIIIGASVVVCPLSA